MVPGVDHIQRCDTDITLGVYITIDVSRTLVLLSICSMLTDPNPDDPLVPDIAHVSLVAKLLPCYLLNGISSSVVVQIGPTSLRSDGKGMDEEVSRLSLSQLLSCSHLH